MSVSRDSIDAGERHNSNSDVDTNHAAHNVPRSHHDSEEESEEAESYEPDAFPPSPPWCRLPPDSQYGEPMAADFTSSSDSSSDEEIYQQSMTTFDGTYDFTTPTSPPASSPSKKSLRKRTGVRTRIKKKYPVYIYRHCYVPSRKPAQSSSCVNVAAFLNMPDDRQRVLALRSHRHGATPSPSPSPSHSHPARPALPLHAHTVGTRRASTHARTNT